MQAFAECGQCGYQFQTGMPFDRGYGRVTITDCITLCPKCGGEAKLVDGTYDFVGVVLAAFERANVDDLRKLQSIVRAASKGQITKDEAINRAGSIDNEFVRIVELAFRYGIPALLVAFVALYLQWADLKSPDQSSDALLREVQSMRAVMEQQYKAATTVDKPHARLQQTYSSQTPHITQQAPPSRTYQNRHERRSGAAMSRKNRNDRP